MAILKKLWKTRSGTYEAIIDLGDDREIYMKQGFREGKFNIESYEPVYDSLRPKEKE